MAEILDKLYSSENKEKRGNKLGLSLEAIGFTLQQQADHILYVLSDNLYSAGTYEQAHNIFCDDEQTYILLSSVDDPYQSYRSWTVQRKPSSFQRYCIDKIYTFFDKDFVDALLSNKDREDNQS